MANNNEHSSSKNAISVKRVSSQVMELKDIISGPLVATIDADSISTRRYLSYLLELAFESYDKETGKVGKLRMLEFTYNTYDVNGSHTQQVNIPLLTLVPLPLLQVKEADFDFDIQIVDALKTDKSETFSLKKGASVKEKNNASEGVKLRVSMAQGCTDGNVGQNTQRSMTANMKVKVKMQQADMPGGLANLLHLTTSNFQIKEITSENNKEKEISHDE